MKIENKYSSIALKNIETILKIRKIRTGTLEKEIGVSIGYFSRFKKRERFPSFEVMVSACKYLGVSVDDLIKENLISDLMNEIQEYQDKIKDCESKIKERFGGKNDT